MKILAAYKPSPLGDAVLAATIREARLRDAEVFIARHVRHDASRVSGPLALMDPGSGQEVAPGGASDDVAKLREDLEGLAWQVRSGGVACDAVLIADRENDAEAILELALNAHVGLIVVGIRRRSPVGKAVLRGAAHPARGRVRGARRQGGLTGQAGGGTRSPAVSARLADLRPRGHLAIRFTRRA